MWDGVLGLGLGNPYNTNFIEQLVAGERIPSRLFGIMNVTEEEMILVLGGTPDKFTNIHKYEDTNYKNADYDKDVHTITLSISNFFVNTFNKDTDMYGKHAQFDFANENIYFPPSKDYLYIY